MSLEFENFNEAVKHFALKLNESKNVVSTNETNKENYKNELGGELIQQFFVIKNPYQVLSTYKHHKYYDWWLYSEILSEMLNLNPPLMYKYMPELFSKHYDLLEDGRMQYSYSSRFFEFNQLVNIYRKLKKNPNSKRCMICIYTPYDTADDRKDVPCTTGYQFIHRNGKLNMVIFYRSWDFFGGFKTYDIALSSFILQSFCSWLNMEPGNIAFYANSLHYYTKDEEQMKKLLNEVIINKSPEIKEFKMQEKKDINLFWEELNIVKQIEEAAYNNNFNKIEELLPKLTVQLFKNMANEYINKNKKNILNSIY